MPTIQFKGKSVIETHHHTVPHCRLEFAPKLSVLSKGEKPNLDGNLIIEGDNLLALKALLPTHAGRVKCVYIDPPYNTGNEGWIYNDNLTQPQFKEWIGKEVGKEGEDATRHDKWCCMMWPRLELLRELLADDGCIFVSIDDNEYANLRLIMDEVFGSESMIGCITWKTRNTDGRLQSMLSTDHEYVLVYSKNSAPLQGRKIDRSDFKDIGDPRGLATDRPLTGLATASERPNLHYTIVNEKTGDRYPPDPALGWSTDKEGFALLLKEDRIKWPANPKTGKPRKYAFDSELPERMPASTFWPDVRLQSGAAEVESILGRRVFAFPKSLDFMERIIDLGLDPNGLVLDATAGSGTTAHAALRLNSADGGNRRFVLVQMPYDNKENERDGVNVCKSITCERVARAIEGYSVESAEGKKQRVAGLSGSFTYVQLGAPLFSEYKDFGKKAPPYIDLARYIFYTETSRQIDESVVDPESGLIGRVGAKGSGGTAYYLLYNPDPHEEGCELSTTVLKRIAKGEKARSLVVYCEKIWMNPEDIRAWADENGRAVRPMLVPFHLATGPRARPGDRSAR